MSDLTPNWKPDDDPIEWLIRWQQAARTVAELTDRTWRRLGYRP